jgi:tRNA-dihydrouridine synthase
MKLHLAPIQRMTIASQRSNYSAIFGGIDSYYAPFIDTSHMRNPNCSVFKDILPENNPDFPTLIPQLLGNKGADFNFFASTIAAMGYNEINWNIGCPFPRVTKKKKGSGILSHPDMIQRFLDEVCKDKNYDLSIKMRLGFHSPDEGLEVIELLNDYPVKGIILHARTGIQRYGGHVDLESFEMLTSASKHPITYNGDIFTVDDYFKIQEQFPLINDFMIGRGALMDPFLPSAIKGNHLSSTDKYKKIILYHDSLYSYYRNENPDDQSLLGKMKSFWSYTSFQIDPSGEFLKKVRQCNTLADYHLLVRITL